MSEQLYSRQASGLVRAFRTHDVFIFNTLGFALGLVLSLTPSFLALQQPQADIVQTLSIGFLVCLMNGLLYAEISGIMPRSGGDYVFISRALSPATGFAANWGLTWSQLFGIGAYATLSVSTVLAPGLVVIARSSTLPELERLGETMTKSPTTVTAFTLLVLASALGVSLCGIHFLRRFLQVGFLFALAGTAITAAALFSKSPAAAREALDHLLRVGNGAGLSAIDSYFHLKASIRTTPTHLLSAVLALPIGYWAYLGFTYSVYLGGEVSQPRRAQLIGIIGALLFGFASYVLLLGRYYDLFGRDTIAAFAFAEKNNPSLLPVGSAFMVAVGAVLGRGLSAWFGILSFFLWYYLLLVVMIQVCVRNVFAWAIDHIVPKQLADVATRRAVPTNAVVTVVAIGAVFAILVATNLINFVNYIALFVACYFITGIAAIALPWRRPDLLAQANTRGSGFRRSRLIVLGIFNAAVFAVILITALRSSDFSGVPATIWPTVFLVLVYAVGLTIFQVARRRIPEL
ncbi:MAG TPA: APC family permease, partial [Thermoanaerobaculia bacterium]|nr:APC family permease [Thermoanaerobaculia bacterium]